MRATLCAQDPSKCETEVETPAPEEEKRGGLTGEVQAPAAVQFSEGSGYCTKSGSLTSD